MKFLTLTSWKVSLSIFHVIISLSPLNGKKDAYNSVIYYGIFFSYVKCFRVTKNGRLLHQKSYCLFLFGTYCYYTWSMTLEMSSSGNCLDALTPHILVERVGRERHGDFLLRILHFSPTDFQKRQKLYGRVWGGKSKGIISPKN